MKINEALNRRTLTENMIEYPNAPKQESNQISSTPSISIQSGKRPQTQVVFSNNHPQNMKKKPTSIQIKAQ